MIGRSVIWKDRAVQPQFLILSSPVKRLTVPERGESGYVCFAAGCPFPWKETSKAGTFIMSGWREPPTYIASSLRGWHLWYQCFLVNFWWQRWQLQWVGLIWDTFLSHPVYSQLLSFPHSLGSWCAALKVGSVGIPTLMSAERPLACVPMAVSLHLM